MPNPSDFRPTAALFPTPDGHEANRTTSTDLRVASAIAAALETASLSEEQLARANELRLIVETEHEAGKHQASVDALAEAKELLGL